MLSLAGIFLYLDPQIPSAEEYRHVRFETPLRVYDRDGALLAEFGERRLIPVDLADVPPLFVRAVLDTEDKRFYEHNGVDYITLFNSFVELVLNFGEITRGGSTITMQLPRNLGTFSLDQVYIRKFKEILLALKIERELSKDEILELYINAVPFGKRAYGAEAAAHVYYGKSLDELNLPQLAMLAGIPQAPSAGNPINGPDRALRRRNLVLERMLEQSSIDRAQYEAAVAAPITAEVHERDLAVHASYAAEWVRQELFARFGPDIYSSGFEAHTTIDAAMQRSAMEAVRSGLLAYVERHGYRGPEGHIDVPPATANEPLGPGPMATRLAGTLPSSNEPRDESGSMQGPSPAWAPVLEALRNVPVLGGLEPALVVALDGKTFTALRANGERITVAPNGYTWARRFYTVDTRGPRPDQASDVVSVGDVIRIRSLPEGDGWALSQLPEVQGALVAEDPSTGAIRALVGGFEFAMNQYNHALQARRQPGSGFKPFVYSAALANGVTPASMFMDAPLVFEDENLESTYRPSNDGGRYHGWTRLREALYRSINLVSMRVLLEVGADNVLEHAARFGFDTTEFPHNTQLAVGGGTIGVTPLDMVTAFTVFANGGYRVEPHVIDTVTNIDGDVLFETRTPVVCKPCERAAEDARGDPRAIREIEVPLLTKIDDRAAGLGSIETIMPARRVLDERNAFIMHTMLEDVVRRGTGARARALGRSDIGGKTGTTNEADTWFNGYNADLAATVWMGYSDHRPLGNGEYGSNGPLPIWIDFMEDALAGKPEHHRPQPEGIITLKIDPRTGAPAAPGDPDAIFEYFIAEYAPEPLPVVGDERRGDDVVHPEDIF